MQSVHECWSSRETGLPRSVSGDARPPIESFGRAKRSLDGLSVCPMCGRRRRRWVGELRIDPSAAPSERAVRTRSRCRTRVSGGFQRIDQLESPKPAEVTVGRAQVRAILDRQRGQGRMGYQRPVTRASAMSSRRSSQKRSAAASTTTLGRSSQLATMSQACSPVRGRLAARGFVAMRTNASNVCQGSAIGSGLLSARSSHARQVA
jgi:hypothetical protein